MVTFGMTYEVMEGRGLQFESAFRDVRSTIMRLDGHRSSRLYREIDDPQQYLILSEWHNREALDAFIHSERFQSVANWSRQQVLVSPPRHEIFTSEPAMVVGGSS